MANGKYVFLNAYSTITGKTISVGGPEIRDVPCVLMFVSRPKKINHAPHCKKIIYCNLKKNNLKLLTMLMRVNDLAIKSE